MPADAGARPHFRGRILFAVGGWLVFVAGWWRVIAVDGLPFTPETLVLLAAVAVAIFLGTAAWVWHNRAIYRRKGPRSAVRPVHRLYTHDRLDRPLDLDVDRLAGARVIVVQVTEEGTKRYRAEA
jgi:hypothetical protein